MTRVRIEAPSTRAQEALGGLVGLTQIWVHPHPRGKPGGGVEWVDGYWRNQRPGESLTGKITKEGKALTSRERAKAGVKLEPPELEFRAYMHVFDARDPKRRGSIRSWASPRPSKPNEKWWAVVWSDDVNREDDRPQSELIPEIADQTRFKVGDRVIGKTGVPGHVSGTVREELRPPTLLLPAEYRVEWDTGSVARDFGDGLLPSEAPKPKFKPHQYVILPSGELAQVRQAHSEPDGRVKYTFAPSENSGGWYEVYEEALSEPLVDPSLLKKWQARRPARNATVDTAARAWSALAYERQREYKLWARDDMVRALELEQRERAWDEGGTPGPSTFQDNRLQKPTPIYWRDAQPYGAPQEGGWDQHDKGMRESHDDAALVADRVEKKLGRKSRWNGGVQYEHHSTAAASLSWQGVLAVDSMRAQRAEVRAPRGAPSLRSLREAAVRGHASVLVHEMAHSVSTTKDQQNAYVQAPAYEEGVVEGWERAFYADITKGPEFGPHEKGSLSEARSEVALDLERVGSNGAYQSYIDELNKIAIALHFVQAEAEVDARSEGYRRFYDLMIRIPMDLRRAAIVEMMEATDLTHEEHEQIGKSLGELDNGRPL